MRSGLNGPVSQSPRQTSSVTLEESSGTNLATIEVWALEARRLLSALTISLESTSDTGLSNSDRITQDNNGPDGVYPAPVFDVTGISPGIELNLYRITRASLGSSTRFRSPTCRNPRQPSRSPTSSSAPTIRRVRQYPTELTHTRRDDDVFDRAGFDDPGNPGHDFGDCAHGPRVRSRFQQATAGQPETASQTSQTRRSTWLRWLRSRQRTLFRDGVFITSVTSAGGGTVSIKDAGPVPLDGTHFLSSRTDRRGGNVKPMSRGTPITIISKTTNPLPPAPQRPVLDPASESGDQGPHQTDVTTPIFDIHSVVPGDTVKLFRGDETVGSVVAVGSSVSIQDLQPSIPVNGVFPYGLYFYAAEQIYLAGNVSPISPATLSSSSSRPANPGLPRPRFRYGNPGR